MEPNANILPVTELLTRTQESQVKKEFGRVLELPTSEGELLAIVQRSAR
jgi:hypothetical protein